MITAFLVVSLRGDVLISRVYRPELGSSRGGSMFRHHVLRAVGGVRTPIVTVGSNSILHITVGDVYMVAIVHGNVNLALGFEFLHAVKDVFNSYFPKPMDMAQVRNNFALVYELLDEVLDYGYPQITTADVLKTYILGASRSLRNRKKAVDDKQISAQVTGAINWRPPNIRYRSNQIHLDVVEKINLLLSTTGAVLRSDVEATVTAKCQLSGMPECRVGLNDAAVGSVGRKKKSVSLDDIIFHQCVKLSNFDRDRSITFIPPDGTFELMKYRSSEKIALPFKVIPIINFLGKTRLEMKVTLKAQMAQELTGETVVMSIPCPPSTARTDIRTSLGSAKYSAKHHAIVWKVKRIMGQTEAQLSAEVDLIAQTKSAKPWSRPPLSMRFTVYGVAASGMKIQYLKVTEKEEYSSRKSAQYISTAGSYQIRI